MGSSTLCQLTCEGERLTGAAKLDLTVELTLKRWRGGWTWMEKDVWILSHFAVKDEMLLQVQNAQNC